jgi:hypothetical protein
MHDDSVKMAAKRAYKATPQQTAINELRSDAVKMIIFTANVRYFK